MSVTSYEILASWHETERVATPTDQLLSWIEALNRDTYVRIRPCRFSDSDFWFYDDYQGEILNRRRSFFSVSGMRLFRDDRFVGEQPMILQPEIGYLGIILKKINGVVHLLMQAKIEPGNLNCVQISPTIQATKSNFMRAHGGRLPLFFSYFEQAGRFQVIYDQIQSEQASRFYRKRNRNIVIAVEEDIEEHANFRWMTLGQLKQLMRIDNLVNMDTRTVLSGLPMDPWLEGWGKVAGAGRFFSDRALLASMTSERVSAEVTAAYRMINDYKMFHDTHTARVPLNQLVDWRVTASGVHCAGSSDFTVDFFDIEISGREVSRWSQPLLSAAGKATFGLLTAVLNGERRYLIRLRPEIGSCDKVEFGPTVQWESTHAPMSDREPDVLFRQCLASGKGVLLDVMLSEEGGRFYHEQNRNVILELSQEEPLPEFEDCLWVSWRCLNQLVRSFGVLNIQLRNLIALTQL